MSSITFISSGSGTKTVSFLRSRPGRFLTKLHAAASDVFLETVIFRARVRDHVDGETEKGGVLLYLLRSRDGEEVVSLPKDPCKAELRRRDPFLIRHVLESVHQFEIL